MLQATTGPNWAEQVTAVGTAIIALSIVGTAVGAFLARRQLVEAKKLRHISLAIDLARRWDDDALISVRRSLKDVSAERFKEIYQASYRQNTAYHYQLLKLGNFFEDYASLEEIDCLDLSYIADTLGNSVVHYWQMWKPAVYDDRDRWDGLYVKWEGMADKITDQRTKSAPSTEPTEPKRKA